MDPKNLLDQAYNSKTGIPKDKRYLEIGLPAFLLESIESMKLAWKRVDNDEEYLHWDCDFCNLQTDINNAEVNGMISTEQAWFLRRKYLRIERMGQDENY